MEEKYKGKIIKTANPTGGKAGKGYNITSTVQVIDPSDYALKKQVRFKVGDRESLRRAWQKAKDFIDGKPPQRGGARPGAGIRKDPLEEGEPTQLHLDKSTRKTFADLGKGNRSLGARRAAEIVREVIGTEEEEQ